MPRSLSIPGRLTIAKNVGLNFDRNAVAIMLYGTNGEVAQDIQRRAYAVQKRMKRLAPVKTGELRDSIRVTSLQETARGPMSKVYSDVPHAIVAEVGRRSVKASGTYRDPNNRPRRATGSAIASAKLYWGRDGPGTAKTLVFENKQGDLVFPESVPAAKGSGYMSKSIDAALSR